MYLCTPPSLNTPGFQQLYYYSTRPESTPPTPPFPSRMSSHLFNNYNIMRPSLNLPISPRIFQQLYATLLESTPPSQNLLPFQEIYMCDPPSIYPSLPEYTPLYNNYM